MERENWRGVRGWGWEETRERGSFGGGGERRERTGGGGLGERERNGGGEEWRRGACPRLIGMQLFNEHMISSSLLFFFFFFFRFFLLLLFCVCVRERERGGEGEREVGRKEGETAV